MAFEIQGRNVVFSASLDAADAMRGLEELGRAGRTGIARALKRTGTTSSVFLARKVADDTGLGVARVKKEISTRVDVEAGTVTIQTAGVRIPLIAFRARGPQPSKGRKGTAVSAVRFGQRVRYPGAFLARVFGTNAPATSEGHLGVFRRVGVKRLPIKQLYGPSIAQVFGKYLPEAAEHGMATLEKHLEHELQFALSQVAR